MITRVAQHTATQAEGMGGFNGAQEAGNGETADGVRQMLAAGRLSDVRGAASDTTISGVSSKMYGNANPTSPTPPQAGEVAGNGTGAEGL